MKKLITLSILCLSFCLYGQNPKKITNIPGTPATASFSWPCNGLQFYQDYVAATNNAQIWRTDGTASGTFPVTNFATGTGQVLSDPETAAVVGNIFYFSFYPGSGSGYELWKTDGTVNGTVQVNTSPVTGRTNAIIANSTHVFLTTYPSYEDLYSIDNSGQVTYLARLKTAFAYNSLNEGRAAIFRDKLVVTQSEFNAQGNPTGLTNLFITDGTVAGSYTQATLLPVVPWHMIPCGDNFLLMQLYNSPYPLNSLAKLPGIANGGIGDIEIFYTPSNGEDLKDYKYQSGSSEGASNGIATFQGNASLGTSIMLSGFSDNHGWELWKTDGTTAGTVLVKDTYPGIGGGFDTYNGFVINGKFIFDAYTTAPGRRIFYSDGTTAGTDYFPQRPVSTNPNYSLTNVCYHNNKAYFSSLTSAGIDAIWQTDGSIKNTLPVTPDDMSPHPSRAPFGPVNSGDILYKTTDATGHIKFLTAINPNYQLWNGSIDNNWNNTANWEGGTVPSVISNVLIPGSFANYPLINSNTTLNNLWINWGNVSLANNASLALTADLSVHSNNSLDGNGNINFSGSSNHTLYGGGIINIPVNISGGDVFNEGGDKTISQLVFQNSNKLYLGNSSIKISQANGITGYGTDRFIVTNGTGRLSLSGSPVMLYPIGATPGSYSPITLTNTGISLELAVKVGDSAYTSYAHTQLPDGSPHTGNAVNKTWYITNTSAGGVSATNLEFQWSENDELPGFNRSSIKVAYKHGSNFDYSPQGAAVGTNPFTFNFPNPSVITVFKLVSDQILIRFYADADEDGYGNISNYTDAYSVPSGYVSDSTDCNDNKASLHPGATELQNSIDDNCDGQVDEGLITTNQFIFLKGSATEFAIGSYGTQAVASVGNNPGKRRYQTTWHYNGKLYVYGGEGKATNNGTPPPDGILSDIWEYDPVTNNWRWLKGNSTLGGAAVYGTKGVAASTNTPGARKNAMSWILNNKFYLFGGNNASRLCDLWEYDPATNNWTWIAGTNAANSAGDYGILGVPAATNLPPGREQGVTWLFNNKLYLFGGLRSNGVNDVHMNDLWEYDFGTGWWTWIKGTNLTNQFGVYGSQGVASPSNMPGSRYESAFASIGSKTYVYGGGGFGAANGGILSDLWEYDNTTGNWTWLKGSTTNDEFKIPGTQGSYGAANTPGARTGGNITVHNNTLYMFGGYAQFFGGSFLSDLWQYDPIINQWRWVKGSSGIGTLGIYGFENVEAAVNAPGGKGQGSFITSGTDLYLFGGRGYNSISSSPDESQNDLWEFNTSTNNWTWLKGASGKQYYGEYGTKGVASSSNKPGSKAAASSIGANGKYYLFGGSGNLVYPNGGYTNEFWEFDPVSNNWKWLKGSNSVGSAGNYGTMGMSAATNEPASRTNAMMWNIGNKVYLFGGNFFSSNLNDLWEYDLTTNNWTWIKGSNTYNQSGVYGTKAVAAPSNTPGARWLASAFTYNNKLYLFGGNGYNSGGTTGELNDLWEYDPSTNNWTWLSGNNAINSFGVYGTINVASASTIPGARESGQMHTIGSKAYLFGGRGFASSGGFQNLNDTWEYDFATNQWTWKKGLSTGGNAGVAGSYGIEDPANYPIARYYAAGWALNNKLYIFSGTPFGPEYNDLWEYNPATNNWRYIKGRGNLGNTPANYGLQGIANHNNLPSLRWQSTAATSGNSAYIYGGLGGFANSLSPNTGIFMNDLWKWVSGPVFLYGNERKIYVNDNNLSGDIYTTAIGNNNNPGTPSAPLATLDFAVSIAQPGDSIFVDAGTYVTPNFTIAKSITILGPNYTFSPNDPTDPLLYNDLRNAEAFINNSTITIGSSNINIEGLTFDAGNKSQLFQNNSTLDYSQIRISKNKFIVKTTSVLIALTGKNNSPLLSNGYFILDNRFERTSGTVGTAIQLNFINTASISGNVFTNEPGFERTQTSVAIGNTGKVDHLTIAENVFDKPFLAITTGRIGETLIDNNKCYNSRSAFSLGNIISEPATLTVTRNLFTNVQLTGAIFYNRTNTNDNSSPNKFICEDNTITFDATGQATFGSSQILSNVQASTVFTANIETTIKRNKLNFTGDFTLTPNFTLLGLRIAGRHTSILIDSNEINLTGTNIPQSLATVSTGVLIFTHPGNANGVIPANAVININNNKVHGFKQSVTFNYAPTSGYGGLLNGINANITNNSFTGDSISINNGTLSQTVNANCNWYGVTSAQAVLNKVTPSTVNYIPWLTNGTDNNIPTIGFQPMPGVCNGIPVVITLNNAANITCNGANNGSVSITASGGLPAYTYAWTMDENPGFSSTNDDISNLAAGNYNVTVTDANGSISTLEVNINEPDLLTALSDGTHNICFGAAEGTATVIAGGGTTPYTYLWSNGETTESISDLAAGIYSVTVTDANGCSANAQFEVTQPTQLVVSITNTSTACTNSATVNVSGGTSGYSYLWSNGATGSSISNVQAGTYSVTVTDDNGCVTTAQVTLVVNEGFNPSASVIDVSCFDGSNGSVTVTNVNGTAPFQYSIDGGSHFQSNNVFNGLVAGTYTITVVDANGCTGFVTKTITQPTTLAVNLNNVHSTCYGLSTGSVNVTVSGGSPSYSYNWNGPGGFTSTQLNISNLATGNYNLTLTDNKGCIATLAVFVPSFNQVSVVSVVNNIACKGDLSGSINVTVSGGTGGGFTYAWSNGATTGSISNLGVGNYNVTITDIGSGCVVTRSFTITQPATTVSLSTSKTNATGCNSLGTITATGSGGTSPYQYRLGNGSYQSSGLFTGLYAGSYIVWVKDANGCTKTATVTITDNGSDQYENNNSKNQSALITINTTIAARIALASDAADWFKFTTSSAGSYTLMLTHPTVNYTFNMYASGNNTPPVAPQSTTTNSKTYNLAANTTYYISVTGSLSYVCYQLSVSTGFLTKSSGSVPLQETQMNKNEKGLFDVIVFGNPSHTGFTLQAKTNGNEKMKVKVFDAVGRVIEVRENLQSVDVFRLGDSYINGTYFADVTQGTNRKVIKLVKQ